MDSRLTQALAALVEARKFIEGFEGDEMQEGLPEKLLDMIDTLTGVEKPKPSLEEAVNKFLDGFDDPADRASAAALLAQIAARPAPKKPDWECFDYYEIRACVEADGHTDSFLGEQEFHAGIGGNVYTPEGALKEAEECRAAYYTAKSISLKPVFWTIYGKQNGLSHAIGDFKTFNDAYEVMNAILAPMAQARNLIRWNYGTTIDEMRTNMSTASALLEDVINQSSNNERL